MCAGNDKSGNLARCRHLAGEARRAGAALLLLPECFAFIGAAERDKFAVAENLDAERPGPILATLIEIATTHEMWVIGGGVAEIPAGHGDRATLERTYNTCVVVSPRGHITALYRKIHLFDVDIPGGAVLCESKTTAAGDAVVVAETDLGRIGLSICYDLRFPELYRELAVRRGAEILIVPAAFTAHTGAAHWHTLLRARAIENQCFVIAAGQWGRHNEKRESYGHSMIIDPWGNVLAEVQDGDGLAVADIDLDVLVRTRTQMPCLEHQVLVE